MRDNWRIAESLEEISEVYGVEIANTTRLGKETL